MEVVVENKCDICNEQFASETDMKDHEQGKMHLKNLKIEQTRKRTLFVAGFHRGMQPSELTAYFAKYGSVQRVSLRGTYGFIEFATEEEIEKITKETHELAGRKLFVQQRAPPKKLAYRITHREVLSTLQKSSSVQSQIEAFCSLLCLDGNDLDERDTVAQDVESTLQKCYQSCKVHTYGSTVNGFGLKGCDLDLLFEPAPGYWKKDVQSPEKDTTMPSITDVETGVVSAEDLLQMPPKSHLQFVCELFRANRDMFKRVLFIPARCPIVKFIHKKTGQEGDISCSSRLVLYNTQLLRFYGMLDDRVTPLMVLLRYWAKFRGLIRVGDLSSYAFSLLIIFFLQNTSPAVLPTVEKLKLQADHQATVAGWECSFCADVQSIKPSENKEPVETLLSQFFKFYCEFDFSYVICPLTGEKTHRSHFEIYEENNDANFQTSPLCIQDPFELSRNVSAFLKVRTLMNFRAFVKATNLLFQPSCLQPSLAEWGIMKIFERRLAESLFEIPTEPFIQRKNSISFTFAFSKALQDLMAVDPAKLLKKIFTIVLQFYNYSLLFDVEVVDQIEMVERAVKESVVQGNAGLPFTDKEVKLELDADSTANSWKFTEFAAMLLPPDSQEDSEPQLLMSVQVTACYPTWIGRKKGKFFQIERELKGAGTLLDLEHHLSLSLIGKKATELEDPLVFLCDFYLYRKSGQYRLCFVLTPYSNFQHFKPMAFFIRSVLTPVLKSMLY